MGGGRGGGWVVGWVVVGWVGLWCRVGGGGVQRGGGWCD